MIIQGSHDYKQVDYSHAAPSRWCWRRAAGWGGRHRHPGGHPEEPQRAGSRERGHWDLEPYTIYQGNPAQPVRERGIEAPGHEVQPPITVCYQAGRSWLRPLTACWRRRIRTSSNW